MNVIFTPAFRLAVLLCTIGATVLMVVAACNPLVAVDDRSSEIIPPLVIERDDLSDEYDPANATVYIP